MNVTLITIRFVKFYNFITTNIKLHIHNYYKRELDRWFENVSRLSNPDYIYI